MIALSSSNVRRVLIVRLSSIGDVILTTPVVASLKENLPDVEVDWIVEPRSKPVVEMCQGVSRIFTFPRVNLPLRPLSVPGELSRLLGCLSALRREMAERSYDVAFDIQGLMKSGIATLVSGAACKVGWCPDGIGELNWAFTNTWVRPESGKHAADSWLSILSVFGVSAGPARFPLKAPADACAEVSKYLEGIRRGGPVLVMNVGSSKPEKCWPAGNFGMIAKQAGADFHAVSVFTWGNEWEHDLAVRAVADSGETGVIMPKTSLFTLAALVDQADAFVGNDTGPMHLAAAFGTPVVGIYGATNPGVLGPYGIGHRVANGYTPNGGGRLSNHSAQKAMDAIKLETVYSLLADILTARRSVGALGPA